MEQQNLENLTYNEAVARKSRYPSDIMMIEGYEKFLMITPNKQDEFVKFLEFVSRNFSKYTDELCKDYCTDAKYQVRAHVLTALRN